MSTEPMTGDQLAAIRESMSGAVGNRVSQSDFARALRLKDPEKNGADRVRCMEQGLHPVSGPIGVAATYLGQGAHDGYDVDLMSTYVIGDGVGPAALVGGAKPFKIMVRLQWPRFVAIVVRAPFPPGHWMSTCDDRLKLRVVQWIDDPETFGQKQERFVSHAAGYFSQWFNS